MRHRAEKNRQADNTKKSPAYNQKDCGYETCALIKSATQKNTFDFDAKENYCSCFDLMLANLLP